jgi:hypothetical protein
MMGAKLDDGIYLMMGAKLDDGSYSKGGIGAIERIES